MSIVFTIVRHAGLTPQAVSPAFAVMRSSSWAMPKRSLEIVLPTPAQNMVQMAQFAKSLNTSTTTFWFPRLTEKEEGRTITMGDPFKWIAEARQT